MATKQLCFAIAAALAVSACGQEQGEAEKARGELEKTAGVLDSGAEWTAAVPPEWNGVLLLWSHGYDPTLSPAEYAPPSVADALLSQGYALAGSAYSSGGWALEEMCGPIVVYTPHDQSLHQRSWYDGNDGSMRRPGGQAWTHVNGAGYDLDDIPCLPHLPC